LPFSEIAGVLDRSEGATQKLASRARRRVRRVPEPDADLERQEAVVDAFFAASRDGDFQVMRAGAQIDQSDAGRPNAAREALTDTATWGCHNYVLRGVDIV
jgi:hypothetical protein